MSTVLATAPAAHAAGQCASSRQNRFDGYAIRNGVPNYEGAAADIVVRRPSVCTGASGNFVTAWALIASNGGNSGGYAQTGYFRYFGDDVRQFAEYNKYGDNNYVRKLMFYPGIGSQYQYVVRYNVGTHQEESIVESTSLLLTDFDPKTVWTGTWEPQWFGEALYLESDMPGNSTAKAVFTALQGQQVSDGLFHGIPCNCDFGFRNDNPSRWVEEGVYNNSNFDIYTK